MTPIICTACGHENENSRVFCQSCGMRLPLDAGMEEQKAETNRVAEEKAAALRRERYQAKTDKKFCIKDFLAGSIAFTVRTGVLAAALAAIILSLRTPGDLPPAVQLDQKKVDAIQARLVGVADRTGPVELVFSEDLLNTYLRTEVELQAKTSGLFHVNVERTFVMLNPGEFQLGVAYTLLGKSMVIRTRFVPVPPAGEYSLEMKGGSIGLLPLPSWVFRNVLRWYDSVAKVLERQLSILTTADMIQIQPKNVSASWKANPQASAPRSFSPSSLRSSEPERTPSRNPLSR